MRPGTALWAYLGFVFIGAALLAPWVFHAIQYLAAHSDSLAPLAKVPFRRVVSRCLLILGLVGIWPLIKALKLRSWRDVGIHCDRPILRDLFEGILLGSLLLAIAATFSLALGAAEWDFSRPISAWPSLLLGFLATAVIVSVLEELLFRGAIYTGLRRATPHLTAVLASSAIYSITHFFARAENPPTIQWHSGFQVLGKMLSGFTNVVEVFPGFLSLTLVGIIFALAFRYTGALYMSIGLHAALIFGVRFYAAVTNQVSNVHSWFWGTEKLVDGWFCFFLLLAATIWFARKPRNLREAS